MTEQELSDLKTQLQNVLASRKPKQRFLELIPDGLAKQINSLTPLLQHDNFSWAQKIHWILNDLTEFPKCQNVDCQRTLNRPRDFDSVTMIYRPGCCASCSQKSLSVRVRQIKSYKQNNNDLTELTGETNIFELPAAKEKIKNTFETKYGKGITNPGQVINRRKGYDNFLKNVYVKPLFSYDEYNEMCKCVDRYHNKNLKWECLRCGHVFFVRMLKANHLNQMEFIKRVLCALSVILLLVLLSTKQKFRTI